MAVVPYHNKSPKLAVLAQVCTHRKRAELGCGLLHSTCLDTTLFDICYKTILNVHHVPVILIVAAVFERDKFRNI